MNTLVYRAVVTTACTMAFLACEKNEKAEVEPERLVTEVSAKSTTVATVINNTDGYIRSLDKICPAYLQYTTKFNLTKLPQVTYDTITSGNFSIIRLDEYNVFLKGNPTTDLWWRNWNKRPLVEVNNPYHINFGYETPVTLKLSRMCYTFGFELGVYLNEFNPKPIEFTVAYYNRRISPNEPISIIKRTLNYPNDARLFSLLSDTPFDEVIITFEGTEDQKPRAYAIASIRQTTNLVTYEQLKSKLEQ